MKCAYWPFVTSESWAFSLSRSGVHMTDSSATATPKIEPHHRLVLRLLLISAFVVILNETIMGVAMPRLMVSFHVPASSAQWLTTAFLLTMATVIPITGFMLQRLNTRPVFIIAISLFRLGKHPSDRTI